MGADSVLEAYEAFAPVYNEFNHLNDYEMWLGRCLLPELEKYGLRKGRVLDVGCGTGRAFAPLLQRGWQVRGCDLSPAMLERAAGEAGDRVELSVADMRELPVFGEFELVVALNDPVNYLMGDDDLERAFAGMRANLADGGLMIFDCNSWSTYMSTYSTEVREVEYEGSRWVWRGVGEVGGDPNMFESRIEGDGIEEPIRHQERFRSEPEIRAAMAAAGVDCLAVLGMEEVGGEVVLTAPPDDERHYKIIYIGAKASPTS
ncbi:MAG TPA: class I SAM-dependent methyltransferase [Solirubrobacterales bacterium]|nr:class I SAM-dependent methyltransferase [Solirubrobacterales bacterium]